MIREIQDKILKLKKEKNIFILAHTYQSSDILEIADEIGDSFQLSLKATEIPHKTVLMCGVRFMADTVKILSPEKKVILPVSEATCPMAEQFTADRVLKYKKQNPTHKIVSYINTTTELKSVSDVCVTSSIAVKVVNAMEGEDILFIPDYNLGTYVKKFVKDKNIILWKGMCPIHASVTVADCEIMKKKYPNAKMIMHPELTPEVLEYADFIGSTSAIIKYCMETDEECLIGTEKNVADYLKMSKPEGRFRILSKKLMCPNMQITSISDILDALTGEGGEEIVLDEELRLAAKKPLDEMIRLGNS
ncbi:MAG: quinolinate synthase NadA [Oscillospiraceae bacterium]|nr:quinolinate synthase NadA [Oscillospiraceae bacterium]